MNRFRQGLVSAALVLAASAAVAQDLTKNASEEMPWTANGGYAFQLDNDLFSGTSRDQDYSWGGAYAFASPRPGKVLAPLHAARAKLDAWLAPEAPTRIGWAPDLQATQIGIIAMTPSTLRSPEPLFGDRPYSNLIFVTSSQIHVLEGGDRARFSSLTVGILGLHVAEELHRYVHKAVGNERPLGWDHQISAGGEPTARYVEARQWLIGGAGSRDSDAPEFKFTLAGSAGFITEGSVALSGRWGRLQSPWWSFDPELGDYTSAPVVPVTPFSSNNPAEIFGFAGVRLKARAYNALLQGQFRHSDVRVQGDDFAHAQAEAWVGLATAWSDYRITYAVHFASKEIVRGPGERSIIWAGINFEKAL